MQQLDFQILLHRMSQIINIVKQAVTATAWLLQPGSVSLQDLFFLSKSLALTAVKRWKPDLTFQIYDRLSIDNLWPFPESGG